MDSNNRPKLRNTSEIPKTPAAETNYDDLLLSQIKSEFERLIRPLALLYTQLKII